MKKAIVLLLALFLLMGTVTVPVSATDAVDEPNTEIVDWSYDNSILVTVTVAEEKVFTPEDFPEVECIAIYVVDKEQDDIGFTYKLMLVFELELGSYYMEQAIESISNNTSVLNIERNYYAKDYSAKASNVRLNENIVWLKVGEKTDLYIDSLILNSFDQEPSAIIMQLDSSVVAFDELTEDYFSDCGLKLDISGGENVDGVYSAKLNGFNYGHAGTVKYIDALTKLSTRIGVLSVTFHYDFINGNYIYEEWTVANTRIADIELSGGELDYDGSLYQIATIKAISVGTTYVTVQHGAVTDTCVINVYDPADVNGDGSVDSLDAALLLKYEVGIVGTDALYQINGGYAGDVNGDYQIDSLDAAQILKRDAGIYN